MFQLDQIADVGVNLSRYFKLFGREVIFEVLPFFTCMSQTDGQTGGRTDDVL